MHIKPTFYLFLFLVGHITGFSQESIPLPEHPRPDYERKDWINLNGTWEFAFDPQDQGLDESWFDGKKPFDKKILVPFPWGSPASGLQDEADYGWYRKNISIPENWKSRRTFLVIGASDWETTVWIDGNELGKHEGGYLPFSVELTPHLTAGSTHQITLRVDDKRRMFTLYGKQGYGNARGIWQTVYLESRGEAFLDALQIEPDIDRKLVTISSTISGPQDQSTAIQLKVSGNGETYSQTLSIAAGETSIIHEISLPNARLWTLKDPFLYDLEISVGDGEKSDVVRSYFGMRKISAMKIPGKDYTYVALNNEPIYLQLALDQSYHPTGFYTFPSDEFMREEIQMAKDIGLNGIRTHVKIDIPRKLYWADKLGLLIMADLPNSWGEPDEAMRNESEQTLRAMIKRDFNHPSIFSWVIFNETWGLFTNKTTGDKKSSEYLPETQRWVASMYRLAKSLDDSRIIEDNSICCGRGHTETDLNSWHAYLPGWEWDAFISRIDSATFLGSEHHFEKSFKQGNQPNINSECGNVWGYEGSTGDVDWSWDYHRMINSFRNFPKISGWLYTEHHDVINEWNGYWRFDRSQKFTGLEDIVPGMSLNDLHAQLFVSTGNEISKSVKPGATVEIPLYASFMSGAYQPGTELQLNVELDGIDYLGNSFKVMETTRRVIYQPWHQEALAPIKIEVPQQKALLTLRLILTDRTGQTVYSRNFMHLIVEAPVPKDFTLNGKIHMISSIAPAAHQSSNWSQKKWSILNGLKENGAGSGYFEYKIQLPAEINASNLDKATFIAELSTKPLLGKDKAGATAISGDFMLGKGTHDPALNPNAYPMTDENTYPGKAVLMFNGIQGGEVNLPDDPADHRGVLSWHYQLKDKKLREAGTYGFLVKVNVPQEAIQVALKTRMLIVRLNAKETGLAVYGEKSGRYPINPAVVWYTK